MLKLRTNQRGLSLIESMVALLVISIGLLGIAALQITAMNQNASSLNHSQAVWIAYNMSDRIRANLPEFNNYDGIDTTTGYTGDCSTTCSPDGMRLADAAEWTQLIQNLPSGRGQITSNADGLLITVMWDDDGTGATGTGCGGNPDVDLTCYTLAVAQ
ncbi:MAG: type IV pilus modification protein PilV [Gammaproteobacteria bacterium]|nr:type IV pilus modification protein PilV [Gammaproteobacteria bacterium]